MAARKAALILMKNSHFDRTPQCLECRPDLIVNSKSSVALDDDSRHKRRLARRHKKALLNNSKIQMLPAGVDTGKFLEQQLRRVTNYGVGPKRIADLLE